MHETSRKEDTTSRVVIRRGETVPFESLPRGSIALDGYVQGPYIDAERRGYSFDHHAGCIRHATLSTCEMALDAVRVGLDPRGMIIRINDLDADTVLSVWVLLRPAASFDQGVAAAVRSAGRVDALGPGDPGPGLFPCLRWALEPMLQADAEGRLRFLDDRAYRGVLDACLERLDRWLDAGAPRQSARMQTSLPSAEPTLETLHFGQGWSLVHSSAGLGAFGAVYASGTHAAVVANTLDDGTTEYTVGKASEFVAGFDVPGILAALARAELRSNPKQSPAHNWGGGSTIGGSPRNPDGSSSRLTWQQVVEVIERVLRRARPR